jgi:hypothetical protein
MGNLGKFAVKALSNKGINICANLAARLYAAILTGFKKANKET